MKGKKRLFLMGVLFFVTGCLGSRAVPDGQGSTGGVSEAAKVVVLRDDQGIPHIFADDAGDLFFGLGYTMAGDRLFQMDLYRHVAQGRLSEWFFNLPLGKGARLVQVDMLLKCFELERKTLQACEELAPEMRILLEQFSNGINRLLVDREESHPPMYRFLGVQPEPWSPADVMSVAEIFGVGLGLMGIGTEILHEAMVHAMGEELAEDFFRRLAGGEGWTPRSEGLSNAGSLSRPLEPVSLPHHNLFRTAGALLMPFMPRGSNNWVVSADRSESGLPILANDPHVPLGPAPSFWYHAHIEGAGFSVEGLLYPGYPAFCAAWNGAAAWGVTNVMADQMDLYREKLDPDTPDRYQTADGWKEFEKRTVQCKVRWGRDRSFVLRTGEHGFLIPPEALKSRSARKHPWMTEPICVRYTGTDPAAYFEGQVRLMRARSSEEVKLALERIGQGPTAYNYVWATAEGDIGYHAAGRIPVRADQCGFRPKSGWMPGIEWLGTIPFDDLPSAENPPAGFLHSANERIAPPDYPWYISAEYARPYRSERIRQLLEERERSSVERFQSMHADVYNLASGRALEILWEALSAEGEAGELDDRTRQAREILKGWDRQTSVDSPGAALYEAFYQALIEITFSDEMGEELSESALKVNFAAAKVMESLQEEPEGIWFDKKETLEREGRNAIFVEAFEEAVEACVKEMGPDPGAWAWGKVHRLAIKHPLGGFPLMGRPYRIDDVGYPGDNDTVNGAYFSYDDGRYNVMAGAASRFIVDLGRPEGAWFSCSTGMAGEPSSDFFKNLTAPWYRNEYFFTRLAKTPEDLINSQE